MFSVVQLWCRLYLLADPARVEHELGEAVRGGREVEQVHGHVRVHGAQVPVQLAHSAHASPARRAIHHLLVTLVAHDLPAGRRNGYDTNHNHHQPINVPGLPYGLHIKRTGHNPPRLQFQPGPT
jgi:hypothetical protein